MDYVAVYKTQQGGGGQSVATPTFNPAGGTYASAQSVTLSDATPGSSIRYTLDGSAPTAASTLYTGPINVAATTTVKAIGLATGLTNSATASATYTIGGSSPDYTQSATQLNATQAQLSITPTTPAAYVDVHYLVNGAGQQNIRMTNNAGTWTADRQLTHDRHRAGVLVHLREERRHSTTRRTSPTPKAAAAVAAPCFPRASPRPLRQWRTPASRPPHAVDGNTATRWSSAFSDPQWLQVDLGATAHGLPGVLNWEAAYATAFQIQTSTDGTTWTPIYSTTTGDRRHPDPRGQRTGRYVRMYGTARATRTATPCGSSRSWAVRRRIRNQAPRPTWRCHEGTLLRWNASPETCDPLGTCRVPPAAGTEPRAAHRRRALPRTPPTLCSPRARRPPRRPWRTPPSRPRTPWTATPAPAGRARSATRSGSRSTSAPPRPSTRSC